MRITSPIALGSIRDQYIRSLLYGGTGIGKTIFSAGSQRMMTFYFDVDDGVISAKAWLTSRGLNPNYVHVWPVKCQQDFIDGWTWFINNITAYQLLVVDTATELQQVILGELRNQSGQAIARKQDWGVLFTTMEDIIRSMRHIPVHVLWVAHETEKEDEFYHRTMYRPSFQGQFGHQYGKHFSEIWRYCIFEQQVRVEGPENRIDTQTVRVLNCHRDQFTHAKDRSLGLEKFEAPDLDAMFDKMIASIHRNNIDLAKDEENA